MSLALLPPAKGDYTAVIGAARRNTRRLYMVALVALALMVVAFLRLNVSFANIGKGLVQLGTFLAQMFPPTAGGQFPAYLSSLAETVAIAFLGTFIAAVIAFPLGFIAARTVIGNRIVHLLSRRFLDSIRGVDTLIWALIWINVVGLGPFAGVLAIITSDIGAFGKLFSEAVEATDRKASEGVRAAGGSQLQILRFAVLPQVLPVMLSQVLYYFESNTRSATIIGIVGAGGIGLQLSEQIRTFEWDRVAFIVLMILVTVTLIDFLSSRLRLAIIGNRVATP